MNTFKQIVRITPEGIAQLTDQRGHDSKLILTLGAAMQLEFDLREKMDYVSGILKPANLAKFAGCEVYYFALDSDFDGETLPKMIISSNAKVFKDDNGYTVMQVPIANTATEELMEAMKGKKYRRFMGEICGMNLEGVAKFAYQFPVTVNNRVFLEGFEFGMAIDKELSDDSENPVANNVIKAALDLEAQIRNEADAELSDRIDAAEKLDTAINSRVYVAERTLADHGERLAVVEAETDTYDARIIAAEERATDTAETVANLNEEVEENAANIESGKAEHNLLKARVSELENIKADTRLADIENTLEGTAENIADLQNDMSEADSEIAVLRNGQSAYNERLVNVESRASALESGKANSDHTHTAYETRLTSLERGKADSGHKHTEYAAAEHEHSNYESRLTALEANGGNNGGGSDAPAVTVDSALNADSGNPVANSAIVKALAGKADSGHTHTEYASADHTHTEYAAAGHTHTEYATVTALNGKADSGHTHTEYATVSALNGKADRGDVIALQTTVAGKADSGHTHSGYETRLSALENSLANVETLLANSVMTAEGI